MKIRKMVVVDAENIAKLHKEVWRTTYKNIMTDNFLGNLSIENLGNNIARGLEEKKIQGYVAIIGDEIVGDILFGKSRQKNLDYDYEIYALNVSRKFQGQSLGKILLQNALENLSFCDKIYLMVVRENFNARTFYESQNFVDSKKIVTQKFSDFELHECVYEYKFRK